MKQIKHWILIKQEVEKTWVKYTLWSGIFLLAFAPLFQGISSFVAVLSASALMIGFIGYLKTTKFIESEK